MRQVLNDVTIEELPEILLRLGVRPGQRLRITLETLDENVTLPGDEAEEVAAFDWALDEVERA